MPYSWERGEVVRARKDQAESRSPTARRVAGCCRTGVCTVGGVGVGHCGRDRCTNAAYARLLAWTRLCLEVHLARLGLEWDDVQPLVSQIQTEDESRGKSAGQDQRKHAFEVGSDASVAMPVCLSFSWRARGSWRCCRTRRIFWRTCRSRAAMSPSRCLGGKPEFVARLFAGVSILPGSIVTQCRLNP